MTLLKVPEIVQLSTKRANVARQVYGNRCGGRGDGRGLHCSGLCYRNVEDRLRGDTERVKLSTCDLNVNHHPA